METIAPMRVKRRPDLAVILSQCRVIRCFRAPNHCPRYRSFCCHCRCQTSLADPSYSRLGVLEAEHPLSSTGSNSVIMWDRGHPNAPHNNTLSDDSDDEYECAAVAVVLWHYYTYMERPPPRPKHTSALTSIMRVDYLLDGHNDLIRAKIRMGSDCIKRLSSLFELKGYLRLTRNMNMDEQLVISLYIAS